MAKQQKKTVQQLAQERVDRQRLAEMVAAAVARISPPKAVAPADVAQQKIDSELFQRQVQAEYAKLAGPAGLAPQQKSVAQLAFDRVAAERQSAAVAAEVARLKGPGPAAPTAQEIAQDYAQKQVAARQQQQLNQRELERMTGTGEFAPRAGLLGRAGGVLGAAADASGFGGLFARAHPGATAADRFNLSLGRAYALSAVGQAAGNLAEVQYQPFLTNRALADRATLTATPIVGSIYRGLEAGSGAIDGTTGRIRAFNERAELGEIRGRMSGRISDAMDRLNPARYNAMDRADFDKSFVLDRLESAKRESAIEKKLYEENVRLLPYRQRLTEATRSNTQAEWELSRASKTYANRLVQNQKLESELDQIAAARATPQAGQDRLGRLTNARAREAQFAVREREASAELAAGRESARQLAQDQQTARERVATAKAGVRVAGRDFAEADAREAFTREDEARSEARRLGGAGPLERMRGRMAFQAVRELGLDNVSPDQKAAARQFFPQAVAALEEKNGQRFRDQFAAQVPGGADYRDDVAGATKRADAARALADNLAEADVKATSREMAKVVGQVLVEVIAGLRADLLDEVRKLQQNAAGRALGGQ